MTRRSGPERPLAEGQQVVARVVDPHREAVERSRDLEPALGAGWVRGSQSEAGHQEFRDAAGNSRIGQGVNATVLALSPQRNNVTDCLGHGTDVAGILAGMTYGVSKDVVIHPVKVTQACTGNIVISDLVEGVNWIIATRPAGQPAFASLSANHPDFQSLAAALAATNLVQSGVTLVQSAGNQNQPAANVSMVGAGFPQEIVIAGGMDERDGRWTRSPVDPSYSLYCHPADCAAGEGRCDCGSNYGAAVDIWAPASHIVASLSTITQNSPPSIT